MPSTADDQARALGFIHPKVKAVRLRRGERFTDQGTTQHGIPYEMRYEIVNFDNRSITLAVGGRFGKSGKIENNTYKFDLLPNRPTQIPQFIYFGQPSTYIAFIAPSASQFRPREGGQLIIALGEVRDTVPPPPKK